MKVANLFAIAVLSSIVGIASAEGPVNYPEETPMVAPKTRAQVKAELAEARRLGLVVYGEVGVTISTPDQEKLIADAGRRAVAHEVASK
jgi:hypothetical protein